VVITISEMVVLGNGRARNIWETLGVACTWLRNKPVKLCCGRTFSNCLFLAVGRCVTPASRQPGHLAPVHWGPRGFIQKYQDDCGVSCWWVDQRTQGQYVY